jgi:hypothetical protein
LQKVSTNCQRHLKKDLIKLKETGNGREESS